MLFIKYIVVDSGPVFIGILSKYLVIFLAVLALYKLVFIYQLDVMTGWLEFDLIWFISIKTLTISVVSIIIYVFIIG